VIDVSWLQL